MPSKDRSDVPPDIAQPAPTAGKTATSDAEWPRLLARVVERIVTAELHEFEDTVMEFLDSAVADAYATFLWICTRAIGTAFLLAGLVLFLGIFLQWWADFALVGLVVIAVGAVATSRHHARRRRSHR